MGDTDQGTVHAATPGGVAGSHPDRGGLRVLAAPSTEQQFNTVRSAIFPIACFKVEDVRFDFDSSLVLPEAQAELPLLAQLIADHTEPDGAKRPPPASVFGHADPVNTDDYNKTLSGRRAASVYGLLTRRAEVWEDLYGSGGQFASTGTADTWGTRAIQVMLNALPATLLGPPADATDSVTPDPLAVDGAAGPRTQARVKRFQAGPKGTAAGLAVDGDPGPATRKALFLAYMDVVCIDPTGKPFQLDPATGFLGHKADPAGKGDFQGCGEFNPVLLLSNADQQRFDAATDKSERNAANAPNRRVMVLLFRPGATVTASYWPCPTAKEGTAGCRKRFWSDGEQRRTPGDLERHYEDTQDTFACRFYQRLLRGSPCEVPADAPCQLAFTLFSSDGLFPRKDIPFHASGPGVEVDGKTDEAGTYVRFPVAAALFTVTVADASFVIPSVPRDLAPQPIEVPFYLYPDLLADGQHVLPEEAGDVPFPEGQDQPDGSGSTLLP